MEREESGFIFRYQGLRVLLKGGSDSSGGSGEKGSIDCRLATFQGMKLSEVVRCCSVCSSDSCSIVQIKSSDMRFGSMYPPESI